MGISHSVIDRQLCKSCLQHDVQCHPHCARRGLLQSTGACTVRSAVYARCTMIAHGVRSSGRCSRLPLLHVYRPHTGTVHTVVAPQTHLAGVCVRLQLDLAAVMLRGEALIDAGLHVCVRGRIADHSTSASSVHIARVSRFTAPVSATTTTTRPRV